MQRDFIGGYLAILRADAEVPLRTQAHAGYALTAVIAALVKAQHHLV
jgi:hypothetical protein